MGLSRNLKRIGMAAHNEKRDQRDWLESQKPSTLTDLDHARIVLEVAKGFYNDMRTFYGDNHSTTLEAKDKFEKAQAHYNQLEQPSILEGVTAPVIGYVQENRVTWNTNDIPASYVAVWDDDLEVTRFVQKATAPGEGRGGQEAMKKPAEQIIQQ